MIFLNMTDRDLSFDLDGVHYDVAILGKVEIPDRVAYCVALHNLPLVDPASVEPVPVDETEPPKRKKN